MSREFALRFPLVNALICPPQALDVIAPHLVPELADHESLEPLRRVLRELPAMATVYGLEIPLDGTSRRDFLLAVSREDGGHKVLAQAKLPVTPAWERVRDFCEEWSQETYPFKAISHIWLEFDRDGREGPSLFIAPEPGSDTPEQHYPLLERTCRLLLSQDYEEILQRYREARENLPASSRIRHLGFMLPRQTRSLRIVCDRFPVRELESYLRVIRWPGDFSHLREVIDEFMEKIDFVFLDLDLRAGPEIEIGLEVSFENLDAGTEWRRFLSSLESREICKSALRVGLEEWSIPRGILLEGSTALWRFLNHVKLILRSDGSTEAKAYLGFTLGKKPPV